MSTLRIGRMEELDSTYVWDTTRSPDSPYVQLFDVGLRQTAAFERTLVDSRWQDGVDQGEALTYLQWCVDENERHVKEHADERARLQRQEEEQQARKDREARAYEKKLVRLERIAEQRATRDEFRARTKAWHAHRHFAVFARNHEQYLRHAAEIGMKDPSRQIVFRSRARWVAAASALNAHGPVPILFAVVNEGPSVVFQALLEYVLIDPVRGSSQAKELLGRVLKGRRGYGTTGEGLWSRERPVRTLYVVSGCHEVAPRRLDELRRWNSRGYLSQDYKYSYALLRLTE